MTFKEALAALHEVICEPIDIEITVGHPESPQVTIGLKGTLVRAINRGPGRHA